MEFMLRKNFLREKISARKPVIGTWLTIPSLLSTDIISDAGLDFVIADSEHASMDPLTVQGIIVACETNGVSPVVRVRGPRDATIGQYLDAGVHCIQAPNVQGNIDVQDIVRACKYPPDGDRGYSPFTRAASYADAVGPNFMVDANANTLVAVHVESASAIVDLDVILDNREIDIIFLGLFDLSKSIGLEGKIDDARVIELQQKAARQIVDGGKVAGTIVTNREQMRRALDMGMTYITYSVDCAILRQGYKRVCESFLEFTTLAA